MSNIRAIIMRRIFFAHRSASKLSTLFQLCTTLVVPAKRRSFSYSFRMHFLCAVYQHSHNPASAPSKLEQKSTKQIIQIENYRKQKQCVKQRPKLSPGMKNRTDSREENKNVFRRRNGGRAPHAPTAMWMTKLDTMFADSFAKREKNCICIMQPAAHSRKKLRRRLMSREPSRNECENCGHFWVGRAIDRRDNEPANWI